MFPRFFVVLAFLLAGLPAHGNNHLDEFEDPVVGLSEGLDGCLSSALQRQQALYTCIGYTADNCLKRTENQTTAGMELCHLDEMRGWDSLLNRYYKTLRQGGALTELRDVQRAWISYRDQKCDLYDVFYQGGSMARWLRADCMRQETARRVIDLYVFVLEVEGR